MLSIYLCEDDTQILQYYSGLIEEIIEQLNLPASIKFATENPESLQNQLAESPTTNNLFILDIHLQSKTNGIQLASVLQSADANCDIIFLTSDPEQVFVTYQNHFRALDYIVKGKNDAKKRLTDCLRSSLKKKPPENQIITLRSSDGFTRYNQGTLVFFCSNKTPGQIELHTLTSIETLPMTLNEAEEKCPQFIRTHKCFLVNPENILRYNPVTRFLYMKNQEVCEVAFRKRKLIESILLESR